MTDTGDCASEVHMVTFHLTKQKAKLELKECYLVFVVSTTFNCPLPPKGMPLAIAALLCRSITTALKTWPKRSCVLLQYELTTCWIQHSPKQLKLRACFETTKGPWEPSFTEEKCVLHPFENSRHCSCQAENISTNLHLFTKSLLM